MAVTITVQELAAAIRAGEAPEILSEITRLRSVAILQVEKHASEAPDAVKTEAVVRWVGYAFDRPTVARGTGLANSLVNSGAGALLLPWRVIRAGTTTPDAVSDANEVMGSVTNPVTDVDIVDADLVVRFADGTVDTQALPAGDGTPGIAGADQVARDAAAAAQTTADAAALVADAATTPAEAASLIRPFARLGGTETMPAERLAENPVEDGVPVVVQPAVVRLDSLTGTPSEITDQTARSAAAAAQATADFATTPAEASDQARIAVEPWARLGNPILIPGDQVDLSGIVVSAQDDVARTQAAANAEAVTEIEAGQHTITPAGLLPSVSGAHPRTIYGRGPESLSAITLHFLKRSVAHRFTIRLDNLTIKRTDAALYGDRMGKHTRGQSVQGGWAYLPSATVRPVRACSYVRPGSQQFLLADAQARPCSLPRCARRPR